MPSNDPADDLDRNLFYSPEDEDGEEYELEAPDPVLLEAQQRHAERLVADAESRIDVDDLFRGHEQCDHDELLKNFVRGGWLRFRTRHLMWATALLAVFLAIGRTAGFGVPMLLFVIVGTSTALFFLSRREQAHEAEIERRKQAFRASLKRPPDQAAPATPSAPAPRNADVAWHEQKGDEWRSLLSFSIRELMIGVTVAALLMGLISVLGSAVGASLLGVFVMLGLIVHMVGFEPPPIVVLCWWMLLMLYVVTSLGAMFLLSLQAGG